MNRCKTLIIFAPLTVLINIFVIDYVKNEKFVYFWDTSGYWFGWDYLGKIYYDNIFRGFLEVCISMRHCDYSLLPLAPIAFNSVIFGPSRLSYILSIVNVLAFPSLVVLWFFVRARYKYVPYGTAVKATSQETKFEAGPQNSDTLQMSNIVLFFTAFSIFSLPQWWIPILRGEAGIAGIFIMFLLLITYFSRSLYKQSFFSILIMSTLLFLLVLTRRWYAYWIVSFFVCAGLMELVRDIDPDKNMIKQYKGKAGKLILIGIMSIAMMLIFANPITKRMILTNYFDIYSAYRYSLSIWDISRIIYGYFGFLFLLLLAISAAYTLYISRLRLTSLFLVFQAVLTTVLFSRTQDFGAQHYYLIIPNMAVVIALFVMDAAHRIKNKPTRCVFLGVIALMLTANFLAVLSPSAQPHLTPLNGLLPTQRHFPLTRSDFPELQRLSDALENVEKTASTCSDFPELQRLSNALENVEKTAFFASVYVVASSGALNDDILRNLRRMSSRESKYVTHILQGHHVDKRDGFPFRILEASYLVVASPTQYHLRPEDQRVVGLLAEHIMERKTIGKAYEPIMCDFVLEGGVRVIVFKRIAHVEKEDLDALLKEFQMAYPDRPELFSLKEVESIM